MLFENFSIAAGYSLRVLRRPWLHFLSLLLGDTRMQDGQLYLIMLPEISNQAMQLIALATT